MKRVEVEADQMPGQDSFLDVLTNIVGILILLVLIVGIRTSHSVQNAPDEVSAERRRSENEYATAYNTAVSTERDVRELVRRASHATAESAFRDSERAWLSERVASAEKEINEYRTKLSSDGQRDFDLRQKIAASQATLDELTRQQVALLAHEPNTEQIECQPTPVAKTVIGAEVHVLLADDHVAIVPFDELLEQMKTDAQANVWRLKQQDDMDRTIGPINNFRLRYCFVKEGIVGKSDAGTTMTGSVCRFSHCYILPIATPAGEPASEVISGKSEFFQQLQRYKPEGTTITIWTYPGNYDRLRELKRAIRQVGFAIAVRPLPKGMPIGASRNGSDSLSE
jgi:hypothetical protein